MDRNRARCGTQTAQPILIIERMVAADMDQFIAAQPRHGLTCLIAEGNGPAARVGLNRNPFRAQRIKLAQRPIGRGQQLHIAIAMEQQLRGQCFQQALPARCRRDQRRR